MIIKCDNKRCSRKANWTVTYYGGYEEVYADYLCGYHANDKVYEDSWMDTRRITESDKVNATLSGRFTITK